VIHRFLLQVDGEPVDPRLVSMTPRGEPLRSAESITPSAPFPFSINLPYTVQVRQSALPVKMLTLLVDTRDAGEVQMRITLKPAALAQKTTLGWRLPHWLQPVLQARAEVNAADVIGEISPFVYGQFIEHLERCIYGGLWNEAGSAVREDVVKLVKALNVPLMRYPGGNFASGYHWEDGIGPKELRPTRFDEAWSVPESNQVGTNEFLQLMQRLGIEPVLVVNDGSGTPQEAARWVEYCNATTGEQAARRAAHGHPEPYGVKIWGIGNEVWGKWQIGTTSAENYAARLREFALAMRAVDPTLRLVAVGNSVMSDSLDDPGRVWNETVLLATADLIDDLSFHLYQPDQEGWQESYDSARLHQTVCAAPLAAEKMIARMGAQLASLSPGKKIGVAFDEWNLWLAPEPQASSMHQITYTMRDALYCASMLNVFQRQCQVLSMANLAQLVNVLPLIVTDAGRAYATPMYWPFRMFTSMHSKALRTRVSAPCFDADDLGKNIPAQKNIPYLDMGATCTPDAKRLGLSLINRHPAREMHLKLRLSGFAHLRPVQAELLSAATPQTANSFEHPNAVAARKITLPVLRDGVMELRLPAGSLTVVALE
jgi:alpha-N-arabinofuranosidase